MKYRSYLSRQVVFRLAIDEMRIWVKSVEFGKICGFSCGFYVFCGFFVFFFFFFFFGFSEKIDVSFMDPHS